MSDPKFKTADGVEINDGDLIYVAGPWYGHCEKVSYSEGTLVSNYAASVFTDGIVDLNKCYSTLEAATVAWIKALQRYP